MKQFSLAISFVIFLSLVSPVFAGISLQISNFEKINDYYSVDVSLSGAASDSSYFIQAMFTKPDNPNYLGFTWGQTGDWIKYVSSPDVDFIKTNFPILENNNTQKILLRPDTEDSGYKGSGDYLVKVKRYTQGGSSTASDNSLTVTLSETAPTPEATPTQTPTVTTTPTATLTQTTTPTATKTPTSAPTATKTPTPTQAPVIARNEATKQSHSASSPTPTATKTPTSTPSTDLSPTADILGESTTLSAQPENTTPTPKMTKSAPGSTLNRILIIIGLGLVVPAGALYFFSDKVKIA